MKPVTKNDPISAKTILIIVVGLVIAYFPSYINPALRAFDIASPISGPHSIILWNWLAVGVLTLYILFVEKKKLSSIRLVKPTEKDITWAFYFWGAAMTWFWLSSIILPQQSESAGTGAITALGVPVVLLMVATAAFTEEFLWRGYVIERITSLTKRLWVGALISFIIFLIPHITFFGFEWILYHAIGTILIYVLYIWKRNLWAVILLHLLIDLPILIPTILK